MVIIASSDDNIIGQLSFMLEYFMIISPLETIFTPVILEFSEIFIVPAEFIFSPFSP